MAILGLISGLALLIWLALRGTNIVWASLVCSLWVIITSQLPLAETLSQHYSFGPLGAFTFAGKFFLLFVAGAVFGRVMGESYAASSIALALVRLFGKDQALVIITLACALLTYGGVVVFVVIFAVYPLGLRLVKESDIPKRLFCAAMALGAGTFTLSALPGTPSIQNVIPTLRLGTDLYAASGFGLFGGLLMLALGLWYLERQRKLALQNGEGFQASATDRPQDIAASREDMPSWQLALLPLILVLGSILMPRLLTTTGAADALPTVFQSLIQFANSQPILWPSIALFIGALVAASLFSNVRKRCMDVLGAGTQDAIMPLVNTAVVIGFGGVVSQTAAFGQFTQWLLALDWQPLLTLFMSVSLVSAITGSAAGGLQIFMETLAPEFIARGMDPELLHRLAVMASGGFDSLPHCGAIVALLTITGLTHKQAYKDVGIITVLIPVVSTLTTLGLVLISH